MSLRSETGLFCGASSSKFPPTGGDADTRRIGDFYAACMDEKAINAKRLAPLQSELNHISALNGTRDLAEEIAHLHRIGADVLFSFSSGQDAKDSNAMIGQADQGGLGLPEKDYYFRDDEKAKDTRKHYVEHLVRVLGMLGVAPSEARSRAEAAMRLETELAKVSLDVTARRDPEKTYHKMKLADFEALSDSFSWSRYFAAIQAPPMESLNVAVPDFFKGQEAAVETGADRSLANLSDTAPGRCILGDAADCVRRRKLRLLRQVPDRREGEEAALETLRLAVDMGLGEALGKAYVERTFGEEGKQRTLDMVHKLEAALAQDLGQITWMTPPTRQKALEKLHAITNKIGYPDKWRDYSGLTILRDDALGNYMRANDFEYERQIRKIGKPVDRTEWYMTPPTVNAYYDPQMNNINFPAGILQPPFFDKKADDATNYGAIGAVIGHELTHGFDDQGRQFDLHGNLDDWWTPADVKAFDERAQCLVNEYQSFTVAGGVKMNGKLTLGENTADNGGLRIAWMALMNDLAGRTLPKKDGFTEAQRFFLGWGQIWCNNETEEMERLQAQTNPHAIDRYRVNGAVSNMPEFQKAFGCKANQPMVRGPNSCRVW